MAAPGKAAIPVIAGLSEAPGICSFAGVPIYFIACIPGHSVNKNI